MRVAKAAQLTREVALVIYLGMGSERTAKAVYEMGVSMGARRPLKTIERWRTEDGWVEKARAYDERQTSTTLPAVAAAAALASRERQANLGRAMQSVAARELAELKGLSGSEVARLGDIGVKVERLAEGEVTERREIAIRTYERVMMPVLVLIRKTVDVVVSDPEERQRLVNLLAPGIDAIRDEHLADVGTSGGPEGV